MLNEDKNNEQPQLDISLDGSAATDAADGAEIFTAPEIPESPAPELGRAVYIIQILLL